MLQNVPAAASQNRGWLPALLLVGTTFLPWFSGSAFPAFPFSLTEEQLLLSPQSSFCNRHQCLFGAFKALADNFAFTLFGVKPSFHEQDQKFLLSSQVTSHHSIKQTKPKKQDGGLKLLVLMLPLEPVETIWVYSQLCSCPWSM